MLTAESQEPRTVPDMLGSTQKEICPAVQGNSEKGPRARMLGRQRRLPEEVKLDRGRAGFGRGEKCAPREGDRTGKAGVGKWAGMLVVRDKSWRTGRCETAGTRSRRRPWAQPPSRPNSSKPPPSLTSSSDDSNS